MNSELLWLDFDEPVTPGWWVLEHRSERLALLQPFEGRVLVIFYLRGHPWQQKRVSAPMMGQAKRYAERSIRPV